MTAGTATIRPAAVVNNASATPDATTEGPAEPVRAMSWKARMMPHTVPSRPMSGAVLPMVPSTPRLRSSMSRCSLSATCIWSSWASSDRCAFLITCAATAPAGWAHVAHIRAASRRLPSRTLPSTSASIASGLPRRLMKYSARSIANPSVATLQARMTIITGLERIAAIQSMFSNICVLLGEGEPADQRRAVLSSCATRPAAAAASSRSFALRAMSR